MDAAGTPERQRDAPRVAAGVGFLPRLPSQQLVGGEIVRLAIAAGERLGGQRRVKRQCVHHLLQLHGFELGHQVAQPRRLFARDGRPRGLLDARGQLLDRGRLEQLA